MSKFTLNVAIRYVSDQRLRIILASLCSVWLSSSAHAQTFICPSGPAPGQRQVGMSGGSPGLASVPVCVEDGPAVASPESNAGDRLGSALADLVKNQIDQMKNLEKDPEFIKLRDGYWAYFHNNKYPNSGKNCSAIFMSLKGAVQISGPGTSYQHAVLVIMGSNIPRPKNLKVVKASLDQGEPAPQNTFAWNYAVADGQLGAIGFTVPSIEAALAGMKDELPFKVSMDGKVVADVTYYDGLKARSALQQCLNGHPEKK